MLFYVMRFGFGIAVSSWMVTKILEARKRDQTEHRLQELENGQHCPRDSDKQVRSYTAWNKALNSTCVVYSCVRIVA
jgi:hypothetical protein